MAKAMTDIERKLSKTTLMNRLSGVSARQPVIPNEVMDAVKKAAHTYRATQGSVGDQDSFMRRVMENIPASISSGKRPSDINAWANDYVSNIAKNIKLVTKNPKIPNPSRVRTPKVSNTWTQVAEKLF